MAVRYFSSHCWYLRGNTLGLPAHGWLAARTGGLWADSTLMARTERAA